jgi:integrase
LLPVNPVERIEGRLGRQDKEIRQADFLTAEELGKMLAAAERVCPREYPILLVMATVGLRIGQAAGLQIGDLDVPRLRLHIRRTVRRGYVGSPKSGKGGVVNVPTSTMAVLANIREIRQVEAAVDGKEPRWLFPGDTKEMPITPEAVGLALRKALAAAGIWKIRPHDLRHTYATLAIQAGVPLLTVSRQLRHASISTTADLYTHAVPGSDRAAAEALEAVLNRNQTLPPRNLTA